MSRRKRILLWIGLLAAGSVAVLACAAVYTFTLDRDARVLRRSITDSLGAKIESTIEVRVSEPLIAATQLGIHWCHDVPEQARVALAALRSASVGVYHVKNPTSADRADVLIRAQDAMAKNGWSRIVGVNDHDTTVLVYAPTVMRSSGTQRMCVAVIDDDKLIVVSARGDMAKLAELAPIHQALHRL
jgi:hypothetical protein